MSVFKKAAAFVTAISMAAAMTACSDTTYGMVIDDYTVPAGIYIYYANSAYSEAVSKIAAEKPDLDTSDAEALKETVKAETIEGMDSLTWIQNKAVELCANYVAVEKKFDELELEDLFLDQISESGEPFVTMVQDVCKNYKGDEKRTPDTTCCECKYFQRGEDWIGICTCPKNKKNE